MNRYERIDRIKKNYRAKLPKLNPTWLPKVQRAAAFIIVYVYDPQLTVAWMKEQCRITGHNFSSRFRYYVGKTPKQYILHHRLAVAKKLLADPQLSSIPISTVAYELGFSSSSAFSRLFKRKTGKTRSDGGMRKVVHNNIRQGKVKKKIKRFVKHGCLKLPNVKIVR